MSDEYELIALNSRGEERAYIRFDREPWGVLELLELIQDWAETDPERTVVVRKSGAFRTHTKPTPITEGEK